MRPESSSASSPHLIRPASEETSRGRRPLGSVDALSVDYHNVARLISVVVWLDWCISAWDNIGLHHWVSTAPFLCRSVGPVLNLKRHSQYHISLLLNINMYLSTRLSLWKPFYRMNRLSVAARTTSSGWNLFNIKIRYMGASLASVSSGENIAARSRRGPLDSQTSVCLPKLVRASPTFSLFRIPNSVKKTSRDVGAQPLSAKCFPCHAWITLWVFFLWTPILELIPVVMSDSNTPLFDILGAGAQTFCNMIWLYPFH